MPRLLVSDTSVLIDLERAGILESLFALQFEIGVPDVLFEQELKGRPGLDLEPLGLQVVSLDEAGTALAQSYRKRQPKLSAPDAFALALAKTGDHMLLAGDGSLRDLATAEGVVVHGTLWLFDQLHDAKVLDQQSLLKALGTIASSRRCRLPKPEVQRRLKQYRGEG